LGYPFDLQDFAKGKNSSKIILFKVLIMKSLFVWQYPLPLSPDDDIVHFH
jgi:hypothetical protein